MPPKAESAADSLSGLVRRSKVATTSSAVMVEPSWNFTPSRRVKVHSLAPLPGSHLVASLGSSVKSGLGKHKPSAATWVTKTAPLLNSVTGSGSEAGTTSPSRPVPPRLTGPAGCCWFACPPSEPQAARREPASVIEAPATVIRRRNSPRLIRPARRSSNRWYV